eukprot:Skav212561  [mRNA]  locus=scaffold2398:38544:40349:+ [translate_table: standard]
MNKGWYAFIPRGRSSLLALDEAFAKLDELKEPLRESLATFEAPYIIVVGNTSVGKSTLLRRLSHLPFFPSESRMCTRLPIKVEIRKPSKDDGAEAKMSLHAYDEATGRYSDVQHKTRTFGLEAAIEEVRVEMESLLEDARLTDPGQDIIMGWELRIRVVAENFPLLNLVDLPGIVQAQGPKDPRWKNAEATRKLFERYARCSGSDHSLFLCAVPATSQPIDWHTMQTIREHGLLDRSLGVISQCDKISHKSEEDQKALQYWLTDPPDDGHWVRLDYGYIATAASPQSEQRKTEDVDADEMALFNGFLPAQTVADFTSIECVRRKITSAYLKQVYNRWLPNAILRLLASWSAGASEYETLGLQPSFTVKEELDVLQYSVSKEVARRWQPLQLELISILERYHKELMDMSLKHTRSLDEFRLRSSQKLEILMRPLEDAARRFLDDDLQEHPVKLAPFLHYRKKLVMIFREDLHEHILKNPTDVAWWGMNPELAKSASTEFVNQVMQKANDEKVLEMEGKAYYKELKEHMESCNKAFMELQKMHKEHHGREMDANQSLLDLSNIRSVPNGPDGCCKAFISSGFQAGQSVPVQPRTLNNCAWLPI